MFRRAGAAGARDPDTCSSWGAQLNSSPCLYPGALSAAECGGQYHEEV